MKLNHSKKPWRISRCCPTGSLEEYYSDTRDLLDGDNELIASGINKKRDGYLISAAPEMYEALLSGCPKKKKHALKKAQGLPWR